MNKALLTAAVPIPADPGAVWLWGLAGVSALVIVILLIKVRLLQKAAREIREAFADRLETATNTLIHISTNDRHMRNLAASLNRELVKLRAQRRRFQQGDRELKNAVTNISHDLRTPLTAICGYLDLLERELGTAAWHSLAAPQEATCPQREMARYVSIIRDRTEALKSLTEELFCYSVTASRREEDYPRKTVLLNEALEESVAAYYTALTERGISPETQITEKKILRSLDPSSLSRILSNLLSNAIKYSCGDLHISLSDYGEIVFSNTAPDLDEIQTGKLFDRFYTVDSGRKSTGLGLSIARALTERMGGQIWAEYANTVLRVHVLFPEFPSVSS